MDIKIELDSPRQGSTAAGANNSRPSVYALKIALSHPDVLAKCMEECEALLRVLGKHMKWPRKITATIVNTIQAEEDDENSPCCHGDKPLSVLLNCRSTWRTYQNVVSRLFNEDPRPIADALADHLASLTANDSANTPRNPNISLLGKLVGLGPLEQRLLDFAELRNAETFRSFLRSVDNLNARQGYALLAAAVEAPVEHVCKALRADAPLRAFGLIDFDRSPSDMEDVIRLADTGESFLGETFSKAEDMLRVVLHPSAASSLTLEDYPHLAREFEWLVSYLRNASQGQTKGTNVLFYGTPGTGKSEFARLIAQHAGLTAFDVKSADDDGDSIAGKTRLTHFSLSQRFLTERERSLVIFDEVEDVFPDRGFSFLSLLGGKASGGGDQSKAWINNQLESSPVPAIWICNSIKAVDDAFLRRFSFHIEFRTPPKTVRERVVRRCLGEIPVSHELVSKLASDDRLSPAQINLASRFASLCQSTPGSFDETALAEAIKASQHAMGRPATTTQLQSRGDTCQLGFLNLDTDIPLEKIEQSLCRRPSATLCFYGAPGAGKTSLAHRLADKIGRPLMIKRASDLLGMYVGESEKNIARMFAEASRDGAVLLLDEADSFLRSRQHANQSWEVTQVNELLQQMESFDGVFICTTNLMDDVDEAALRRFTFKLRFNALDTAQREAMFIDTVLAGAADLLPAPVRTGLQRLGALTPGDFATVRRQETLIGERYSPEDFLQCLVRECAIKQSQPAKTFGFIG